MDAMLAICTVCCCVFCAIAYFLGAKKQLRICLLKRHETWMGNDEWARICDISHLSWGDEPKIRRRKKVW